jgi:hypothetical protein
LQRTFLLKEVPYDGLILRDQLHLILSGHVREIKNPFGYKLYAILNLMGEFPQEAELIFLGDDIEADRDIYLTVQALVHGAIDRVELAQRLCERKIPDSQVPAILACADALTHRNYRVNSIFIRRTATKSCGVTAGTGEPNVVLFTHPQEIATVLHRKGMINDEQLAAFT